MPLRMPRWDLLDQNEQMPVINLPLDRQLWVRGGPGTGKTVLALYRAAQALEQYKNFGVSVGVITYNKTLQLYIQEALLATDIHGVEATTWHSWLYRHYWRSFRERVPEVAPYHPDWNVVAPKLIDHFKRSGPSFHHLFIDEAQDLPEELLPVLNASTRSVTVFSDPNQRIHENSVAHEEIGPLLGVTTDLYFLTRNYRNTTEIMEVANRLQTKVEDQVKQSTRSGRMPQLVIVDSDTAAYSHIATVARNNPDLSIGALGYSYEAARATFQALSELLPDQVQLYVSGANDGFDVGTPGIKVLTYAVAKGLEFDMVVLPVLQSNYDQQELRALESNQAYVAATRARDDLMVIVPEKPKSYIYDRLCNHLSLFETVTTRDDSDVHGGLDLAF